MQLKYFAAATVVVGMFAAAPAFAGDGFIDGSYTNVSASGSSGSLDVWQANFNYNSTPAAGSWGWQTDIAYLDGANIPQEFVSGQLTAFKQLDNARYGVYGSVADAFGDTRYEGGGAFQWSGGNYTLAALAGYGRDQDAGVNYWLVGGNATYYLMDNLSIAGTVGYTDSNHGGGSATVLGARAEWKPAASPVSFFAGYANENPSGPGGSVDLWSLGVRYSLGQKTLKDRDQHGVIMDFSQRQHF